MTMVCVYLQRLGDKVDEDEKQNENEHSKIQDQLNKILLNDQQLPVQQLREQLQVGLAQGQGRWKTKMFKTEKYRSRCVGIGVF
jgi:hypothetical protein